MEHMEIILSRSTPKVKAKIFELLHRQNANLTFNTEQNIYHVDIKIASESKQILDQIAKSLTQTVAEVQNRPYQYSFSRVLDPLQIYDNNIKAESQVDYEALQEQLSTAIDDTFASVKKSIYNKHQRTCNSQIQNYQNPQVISSQQLHEFIEKKMTETKQTSIQFQVIRQQNQDQDDCPSLGISRIMPKKVSLQTLSSQDTIGYFRRLARGY